ncbi:MAG: acetoacetate--CoA ligase [Planctomycetota bacterium]
MLWEPSEGRRRGSQMHDFMTRMASRHGFAPDVEALRCWSVDETDRFWTAVLEFAEVQPSREADAVRIGDGMLGTRWFPGMELNYARHLLRFVDDRPAIVFEPEVAARQVLSRRELRDAVARCARSLAADGVGLGDRVAGLLPNQPEAIIAMLAATSLGAVWSSCSPDFGVAGVVDRFGQIAPKVLITTDGYSYGGKPFDVTARVSELLSQLPSVRRAVIVPRAEAPTATGPRAGVPVGLRDACGWSDYLRAAEPAPPLHFREVAFDHPLFILYSSGTTGVPKCIVHGHGGTLLQHMKELQLHCDLRRDERICYFTTCGWMMWNWLVSALGVGATVVLYDGNPAHPSLHRLWSLVEREQLQFLGTSPKFLAACAKAGLEPGRDHDLSSLRCLLSTGSPLSEEQFRWVYTHVRSDLHLASISGGTDIVSCFMLGNPLLPVRAGEIQCRGLGMDVQAWNDAAQPVVGVKGELVCTRPFPSQPVGFWNDPSGARYREAYFDFYPGVWRHGDFIEITETGGVVVHGRSDATLNPGGVRIGTAEVYRVVEGLPEVLDSIVVGRERDGDVQVVLFVVLREGLALDAALEAKVRSEIAQRTTRRHVPDLIRQVTAIPVTRSGKKVELAVQRMLNGEEVLQREALANPESLAQFRLT